MWVTEGPAFCTEETAIAKTQGKREPAIKCVCVAQYDHTLQVKLN